MKLSSILALSLSLSPLPSLASSILLHGGTIISFNTATSSLEVLPNSSLLIKNDRIASLGTISPSDVPSSTQLVDVSGMILTPGFVDTHRHGWQTAYRTIASNTTLAEYFQRYSEFSQASTYFTPEDVYIGQLTGLYEALNAGVTSMLDHAHHTWSRKTSAAGLKASVDSGARVWWAYAVHSLTNNFTIDEQLKDFEKLAGGEEEEEEEEKWGGPVWKGSPVSVGLAYDRFGVAPDAEVERALRICRDQNVSVITTHMVGPPFQAASGNSPATLDSYSALNMSIPVVISHASSLTAQGRALLQQHNQYLSITPESEHHYGHDHPTSHLIQDQAALGIDTHFTFSTDILTQARMWMQEVRLRLYQQVQTSKTAPVTNPMSVNQAFLLATRNGGLALGREDIGVLRVGAKADIVAFAGDSLGMLGWNDPVAAVMLHAGVGDIKHVLVDGVWKKKNGKMVVDGLDGVKKRFVESAKRIQEVWKETKWPALEGELAVGVDYVKSSMVDVVRGDGNGY